MSVLRHWLDGQSFANLWWRLRGVGVAGYRQLCARCGRTGQMHWTLGGCIRFKRGT